ncbi:GNAT family N-acetyltransferase [Rhodobacter sp. NSM]|uniref:GNAT family N-acetyltransferase n=1 Tax=Rhodobacter sp. NSM TaxID=3457501 RepID=UPI003FD31600
MPRPLHEAGLPMQQHPSYAMACRALGSESLWLDWCDDGHVLGWAQILSRRWPLVGRVALLSRGPVFAPDLDRKRTAAAVAGLVAQMSLGHRAVIVTPERTDEAHYMGRAGMVRMMTGAHVARLSLTPDLATLRSCLHRTWRHRLKCAEAAGLEVLHESLPVDPSHWLLQAEADQARKRGYARLPPAFALAWARHGRTLLLSARDGRRPVAGMLFLIHEPWASYHLAWTSEAGRKAHAHNLLLWRGIGMLKDAGLTALEFGTLDTERLEGIARFKLCTGAQPVALGATWMRATGTPLLARASRALGVS